MGLRRLLSIRRKASSKHQQKQQEEEEEQRPQRPSWTCFSYEEIRRATNGFHRDNLVGRGGYAEVYAGVMRDGRAVAVKRLTAAVEERREEEFLRELGAVGHVKHPNVCGLVGCCVDAGLHLVFEFSSNGSVSSHLHDEGVAAPAWEVRYKIAVGTARGLEYLHKGCRRRIIHRDIKASNILLTHDFQPQISDFGLAKWLPREWTHRAVAPIEGTFGYLAPEYFMHGIVDEKTDVFAFGVFLLELISGRKPVDGSHQSLLSWAKPLLKHDKIKNLVDPRLEDAVDLRQLDRLAFAASRCIRGKAACRPSMDEVLGAMVEDDCTTTPDDWHAVIDEDEDDAFWGFEDLEDVDDPDTSLSSISSSSSSS